MALGTNQYSSGKLFVLKLRTKDNDKKDVPPYFEVSAKNEETGKYTVVNQVKDVTGDLVDIQLNEREWEDQTYHEVKLFLADEKTQEKYMVDLRLNLLSRNIFNTLLALETFENLQFDLYQRKAENGKVYPAVSVKQNGERTNWKYTLDEVPKIETAVVGKKKVTDSTALDEFYVQKLTELKAKVTAASKAVKKTAPTKTEQVTQEGSPAVPVKKAAGRSKKTATAPVQAPVEQETVLENETVLDVPEDEIPFN